MQQCERRVAEIAAACADDVDDEDLHAALASPRRRFLLAYLDDRSGPAAALADVAEALARREREASSVRPPEDEIRTRYADLYHAHVPKLTAVGLIEHDPGANTVALADD